MKKNPVLWTWTFFESNDWISCPNCDDKGFSDWVCEKCWLWKLDSLSELEYIMFNEIKETKLKVEKSLKVDKIADFDEYKYKREREEAERVSYRR